MSDVEIADLTASVLNCCRGCVNDPAGSAEFRSGAITQAAMTLCVVFQDHGAKPIEHGDMYGAIAWGSSADEIMAKYYGDEDDLRPHYATGG